jgi:nucleotide-binding universal stress UspA family protein
MEKILLVINSRKPDMASIDFACRMASLAQTKLTGLFIENLNSNNIDTPQLNRQSYFKNIKKDTRHAVTADTDQSVRIFEEACRKKGVASEVHVDKGDPVREILFESRFADILILDPGISFYDKEESLPSHFVKEILAQAECPVMLAANSFDDFEEIVFCYNGSASSVFAIKLFTYLFPEFNNKKVLLLEINKTEDEEVIVSRQRMMEWLGAHYNSTHYHFLEGEVKDGLFAYFFMKEKMLIVMGSYGRSMLSNLFKKSAADVLIRMVDLPLFIAHH